MHPTELGPIVIGRLRAHNIDPELVAKFTNSQPSTVARWLGGQSPRGTALNSLWHLLAVAGVPSPELEAVPAFGRYLGRLLAFGVIDLDTAQELCGIQNEQAVYGITRGDRRPMRASMELEQLRERYDSGPKGLNARIEKLRKSLPPLQTAASDTDAKTLTAPVADHAGTDLVLAHIAAQFSNSLALARYLATEATPAMRARVRSLIEDGEGIHELYLLFGDLCGERALRQRGNRRE